MQQFGPFYPSQTEGAGWSNPGNAQGEDGLVATYPDVSSGDFMATSFNPQIPTGLRVKRIIVGVRCSANYVRSAGVVAVDNLQLVRDGNYIGDVQCHGAGVAESLDWVEADIECDFSAEEVNAEGFGCGVCFYESTGLYYDRQDPGPAEIAVDAFRMMIFAE